MRRQLGRRLRELREAAGKTAEDVSTTRAFSRTKLWRIEHGRTTVRIGDVLLLARLYRIDNEATDELIALAEASTTTGYLEEYGASVPENLGIYGDLEADATAMSTYNSEMVPGLLQTADYARAVTAAKIGLDPLVVDQRVEFRLQRQRAFFDRPQPGRLDAVMTAGALGVSVGSPSVMLEQIAHLRAVDERENASVRVLPVENGLHTAMRGPFVILDFDDPDDPDLVYVENLIGSRYIERPEHVASFRAALDEVRARAVPVGEYMHARRHRLGQGVRE